MANKIQYTLFSDDPNGTTLREVDSIGTLMSIGEFLQQCIEKCFIDYDGWGYFVVEVDNKKYEILDISFSIDEDTVWYKNNDIGGIFNFCNKLGILEVVWYNR